MPFNRHAHSLTWLIILIASAVCTLGMVVIAGWLAGSALLVQIYPEFAPMQFNTALGFLLCGSAMLGILYRWQIALVGGVLLVLLGTATLSQYVLGTNIGLDELFIAHDIVTQSSHPGRMAPNTALCFALSGIAIGLMSQQRGPGPFQAPFVTSLLSSTVTALGGIALLGYSVWIEDTYGWGQLTRMALHTTLGFILVGFGLVIIKLERSPNGSERQRELSIFLIAGVLVVVLSLWQALVANSNRQLRLQVQTNADSFKAEFDRSWEAHQSALLRMAKRWEDKQGTPYTHWLADATNYLDHFVAFRSIQWLDDHYIVRWAAPEATSAELLNKNLSRDPRRKAALDHARTTGESTVTRPVDLIQGGSGFLLYVPLYTNNHFDGFLLGVLRIAELLDPLVARHNESGFSVRISEGGSIIYEAHPPAEDSEAGSHPLYDAHRTAHTTLQINNSQWDVSVHGSFNQLNHLNALLPTLVLTSGLIICVILSLLMYFMLLSRRQADVLRQEETNLRHLKELAEKSNQAKSDFLANMSHEIRTPINGIMGMAEILDRSTLNYQQRDYLHLIQRSARSLLYVLNDILDISKIEAGKLDVEETCFNLHDRVGDTVRSFSTHAHSKGLELVLCIETDVPEWVLGDPSRINQILFNLIGNAIKFTKAGEVVVQIKRATDDRHVVFEVSDTGIGIPVSKQQSIFDAFSQADSSTTRQYGGTGLGLTIVTQLTRLLGGSLSLDSDEGRGSCFSVSLPLAETSAPDASPDSALINTIQRIPFIVVEDHPLSRRSVADMLHSLGCSVEVYGSAQSLLDALHPAGSAAPGCILLLDTQLPDMTGLDLLAIVRQRYPAGIDKVILTSSSHTPEVSQQAQELAVDSVLTKPVTRRELLTCLGELLQNNPDAPALNTIGIDSTLPSTAQYTILVVEDNDVNQRLMTDLLAQAGYQITLAVNGEEAVNYSATTHYDMIIMDVQMPVMDGLTATAQIRDRESQRINASRTPIVALTANVLKGERERCLAAGMDDYLAKPVNAAELFEMIEKWLVKPDSTAPALVKHTGTGSQHLTASQRQSAQPGPTAEVRQFDLERAKLTTGSRDKLIRQMITIFLDNLPAYMEDIHRAITSDNKQDIKNTAHRLKGSLGNFSSRHLVARLQALESGAFEDNTEALEKRWHDLEDAIKQLRLELAQFLAGSE